MVSCEHLIAKPDELLASVLAAHSNVGILQTQSKGVRKPTVGILSCHDPGLPDAVKLPVRLDAQVPEVSVRRHAHRLIGAGMRCHIGVARGGVVTDIEFPIVLAVAVDLRCWSQDHGSSAMGAAEGSTALGSGLSFFQNGHLLFCVLLEFTQKTGGYPPSLRKEICKLFVNGCEKSYCTQNAIALEEKYRVL